MIIRGSILNPRPDGSVEFIADGAIACGADGRITFVGPWKQFAAQAGTESAAVEPARGLICPPFFDAHIHISQHHIRGRFMDGIGPAPREGRLMAGLKRNVFPAEAKCADPAYTRAIVRDFLADTLSHGVIGGAAYMTVHPAAARIALEILPSTWSVGPVLMNMNCPQDLRTDESTWQREIEVLTQDFGQRVIIADRFAVCVSSELRRQAVALARRLGLRVQTHLNEQIAEKRLIETTLYPDAGSYTGVYERDGLLDCRPLLAHCVRMSAGEFDILCRHGGAAIAHCPTSNMLLGSGVMPLDLLVQRGIDYAICTDVGASPTTSILCEMSQFLLVHAGRSKFATPRESLYRGTLAPARILGLQDRLGSFEIGKSMTFAEIDCEGFSAERASVDEVIVRGLLEDCPRDQVPGFAAAVAHLAHSGLDAGEYLHLLEAQVHRTIGRLDHKVRQVVIDGRCAYNQPSAVRGF